MRPLFATFILIIASTSAHAEVVAIDILRREPFAEGRSFGEVGEYEKITAIARFAVDPKLPGNRRIVDLELAPRNARGLVEFEADLQILAPKDLAKGNGALFYDVNNRGGKLALGMFNRSPHADKNELARPELNGFLMRRGYTVVWSGWIGELLPSEGRLLLKAPIAMEDGRPVRGPVRFEFSGDRRVASLPISRREGHGSYPPTEEGERTATLTRRNLEGDPRVAIPRDKWRLVRMPIEMFGEGVAPTLPQIRCEIEGGIEPGILYELIYEAEGSIVQGVGLASVRDLISFLRHDQSPRNPLRRADGRVPFTRAHAFGVSQSGRFLRHLLWQGFNLDEQGRLVFEGLMPHVAGGGLGFFNHRFAQPTRHNGQHEDHLYPCDVFPFTYGPSIDPFTKTTDGILSIYDKTRGLPKIMHTQSAAEYYHRAGSLVHTDPLGMTDAILPDNVRVYSFAGTQHGPAADFPELGLGVNLPNPADYRPLLRGLLDQLDAWVRVGTEPHPSCYPKIAGLKPLAEVAARFPKLADAKVACVLQQPVHADYGRDFVQLGRLGGVGFPRVVGDYRVLVPDIDADGNDRSADNAMLALPDILVPVATYTGWNTRRKEFGAEGQLANLMGSFIPFARTKADRQAKADPRPSLEERYPSFADYFVAYSLACRSSRVLLSEDVDRLKSSRSRYESWFGSPP